MTLVLFQNVCNKLRLTMTQKQKTTDAIVHFYYDAALIQSSLSIGRYILWHS